ncbi:hypothetical protein Ga0466249_000739 [Sporomusaceae bacterium BoRhaA]|uniref:EcsC family protein n=1 Tax=Pelorhabdus rhamnosifermentans TaxID=2772457 RepID=UPI001C0606A1|nr:EcsC family protein [Pelorhabdus rhamnosifermentans]MBU2699658.1 hypothetical protein [Pelorhabdus rhamnosifermentans]
MLDAYDQKVLQQVAKHIVEPGALVKLAKLWGRPSENILVRGRFSKNILFQKVQSIITSGIADGVKTMLKTAGQLANDKQILRQYHRKQIYIRTLSDIKDLRLEHIDAVADSYTMDNVLCVGTEGVVLGGAATFASGTVLGVVTVPAIVVADASLSFGILSRNVCQIGATYGYSVENPLNMPHFMAALSPHQDLADESYFMGKSMAVEAIYQSKQFLLSHTGRLFDERLLKSEAPQLLRLLYYVLQRLGMVITEKELAMLLPIAGAVLNGGVNVVFQKMGQQVAKDYFRMLFLEDKYDQETIRNFLQVEVSRLRS